MILMMKIYQCNLHHRALWIDGRFANVGELSVFALFSRKEFLQFIGIKNSYIKTCLRV
jgi:hypothetical protein